MRSRCSLLYSQEFSLKSNCFIERHRNYTRRSKNSITILVLDGMDQSDWCSGKTMMLYLGDVDTNNANAKRTKPASQEN
jgi:hypothetical protein